MLEHLPAKWTRFAAGNAVTTKNLERFCDRGETGLPANPRRRGRKVARTERKMSFNRTAG
jgi:hypothetical protein